MTPDPSSWPSWLPHWLQSVQTLTHLSERVTRLEVHQERQESANLAVQSRLAWLERGLQALAVMVLLMLAKSAPSSAPALAELLLGIIRR